MSAAVALATKVRALSLTLADCDAELQRYRRQLAEEQDPESRAVCRFELDRWLDRRLLLMRHPSKDRRRET